MGVLLDLYVYCALLIVFRQKADKLDDYEMYSLLAMIVDMHNTRFIRLIIKEHYIHVKVCKYDRNLENGKVRQT